MINSSLFLVEAVHEIVPENAVEKEAGHAHREKIENIVVITGTNYCIHCSILRVHVVTLLNELFCDRLMKLL